MTDRSKTTDNTDRLVDEQPERNVESNQQAQSASKKPVDQDRGKYIGLRRNDGGFHL